MVTSYYIMQMSKNRSTSIEDYYSNIIKTKSRTIPENLTKCRICLKEGLFPIHGIDDSHDIIEMIKFIGDIEIHEDDIFPKHLCNICHKFINNAILFRKIAKLSDERLKNSIQEKAGNLYSDTHDYCKDIKESNRSDTGGCSRSPTKKYKSKVMTKVQCNVCKKVVNKSYYKEHLTMHDPNHHKYVCDICGKSFRLRCAYHNHSLRHGTGFPFKCKLCPYKGKYAELLKTHMRTHSGDYQYMCTECPARFLFKSNLNSHVLNKHKEREHKCDSCKRAFQTEIALQRHVKVDHLGIKTHVCNICGNTFGYRNAMMKHQRRVHKREKMMYSRMPSYLQEDNSQEPGVN